MIKTVQIKFPELWKNELIYETIEQQYQVKHHFSIILLISLSFVLNL